MSYPALENCVQIKSRVSFVCTSLLVAVSIGSCSQSDDPVVATGDVPAVFSDHYTSAVKLSATDDAIILESEGIPDHASPYWPTDNPLYKAQIDGHTVTPGSLAEQTFVMTIPKNPAEASTKEETALGPIGMALNGVAIYNDREGGNVEVNAETLSTFDVGGGHSGPGGLYHYHFEPSFIGDDDDTMIGHLRDGFPVYARRDADGTYPGDLDSNGGHVGATAEYPDGIYHYHCSTINYLNGGYYVIKSGSYHGTKGTFTY
jgi:YHYH protein